MENKIAKLVSLSMLVAAAGCGVSPNRDQDQAAPESVVTVTGALTSAGCGDVTAEDSFTGGLVGCAGKISWDNRRNLCGAGYRPATAAEWVTFGGTTPHHDYWTDDGLRRNTGQGSGACYASLVVGTFCDGSPMRVCTTSGSDAEGNGCTLNTCGLDNPAPNKFLGGCDGSNNTTAGTLCIPEGCADGTIEQRFPNGVIGCSGSASSGATAAALCAPGYRITTDVEFTYLNIPEARNSSHAAATRHYWTQTTRICPPSGCVGTTGGALCVAQQGCADGSVEQALPEGMVGCAGTVTWVNRESLCARGYRSATAAEWKVLNQFAVSIAPTHNYWTADNLRYDGSSGNCTVSTTSGIACNGGQPMRLCTPVGSDAELNDCNWTNCGLDSTAPNLFFGGCNNNTTAGTLCVADFKSTDIVHQEGTILNDLNQALSDHPETPGIAAAVIVDDTIYLASAGLRKVHDTSQPVLETDKFQMASVSKAVAGAVATRAIDQGTLTWSSTLGTTLPSIFPAPYPDYQNVTLAELNAHASGFDYNSTASSCPAGCQTCQPSPPPDAANDYSGSNYSITDRKLNFARDYTRDSPLFTHGTGFIYGTGAVPAISMVEQKLFATPYDQLLEDFIFRPLRMTHSGTLPDVWGHGYAFDEVTGDPFAVLGSRDDGAGQLRLPVSMVALSIEDMARFAHAALYSPRSPWHLWSYNTQQSLLNSVGRSNYTAAGWVASLGNQASGLSLWKNGCDGGNFSVIALYPARRAAYAIVSNINCNQGLAMYAVQANLEQQLSTVFGAPAAAFPYPEAVESGATFTASSTFGTGYEASKAFDRNYDTRWASGAVTSGVWLKAVLPSQKPVGHVLINESGLFDAASGAVSRFGGAVQEFRVTSWQLFLKNSAGMDNMVASGTTLGANKLIKVNGLSGVKEARLVMNATAGPTITEMHLLPW